MAGDSATLTPLFIVARTRRGDPQLHQQEQRERRKDRASDTSLSFLVTGDSAAHTPLFIVTRTRRGMGGPALALRPAQATVAAAAAAAAAVGHKYLGG